MAQDFVPGAPIYGAPMLPYTPSPLSQMFTASTFGPPSPLAQSQMYIMPPFAPTSPLPPSPMYNTPPLVAPSPPSQPQMSKTPPPRLTSPEFPFCDTIRPYYRDEWTEGDRVSYELEQERLEQAEKEERSTGDGVASTAQQSESELQLGMTKRAPLTDQAASFPPSSSSYSSPWAKKIDNALRSQLYRHPPNEHLSPAVKTNSMAPPVPASRTTTPTASDENNNSKKTADAAPTTPNTATASSADNNGANNNNDYHPLPSFLLATVDLTDPNDPSLPSLACTDAVIDRWHSDSLLPPSSPRLPHVRRTPSHAVGAIGEGRKKTTAAAAAAAEQQQQHTTSSSESPEYIRFMEWCRKERERAEASRSSGGRKDSRRDSGAVQQPKCVRFANEVQVEDGVDLGNDRSRMGAADHWQECGGGGAVGSGQ
ncbi:hypothetical protein SLS58_002536 [Diplodia intermedia]|uniref:Uncharacterized protein n=1 Tax=Diplodia intermedia TaxID=856260 RepID=A0ABR3TYQ1_9PEZI